MLHLLVFSVFGLVCVAGAVNLLVQRHPINSALSLVVVMGSLAVEYLLLGAEFVAAVQVIVYAGAIMVLFVFVIMLLNAGEEERSKGSRVAMLFGVPGVLIGSVLVAWVLVARSGTGNATLFQAEYPGLGFWNMVQVDSFSVFFHFLVAAVTAVVILTLRVRGCNGSCRRILRAGAVWRSRHEPHVVGGRTGSHFYC